MSFYSDKDKQRFRKLVDRKGPEECWPWKGGIQRGKARFNVHDHGEMARRVAYAISYGDVPDGTIIMLTCGLRTCMNHNHMYAKLKANDLGNGTKLCSDCRKPKVYSEFSPLPTSVDGYYNYCKACHRKRKRKEYRAGADWVKRVRPRKYGLTPDDLECMYEDQGHVCAICGSTGGFYGLCVDHDHDTGEVRGLLCSACNAGIAMLKHDSTRLNSAIRYLAKPPVRKFALPVGGPTQDGMRLPLFDEDCFLVTVAGTTNPGG